MPPRSRELRLGLAALLAAVVLAFALPHVASARSVHIELRDGRQFTGRLVDESADTVTVAIAGIESTFPRNQIARLDLQLTLIEQYQQRRSELPDDDLAGRYDIARWLYDHRTIDGYQLAIEELDDLLEFHPSHQQAQLLRSVVTARLDRELERRHQREMEDQANAPDTNDTQPPETTDAPDAPAPDAEPIELLSDEDIAMIRAFEVDLDERPVVVIPRTVVDEIFERYREEPALEPFLGRDGEAAFLRLPPYEQLGILFDLRAREFYDQVIIRSEPPPLRTFRTRYNPNYIARYCAQCHSDDAGRDTGLQLLRRRPNDELTAYTNLVILRRTQVDGQPLINAEEPARSPLVQFGLPPADAATPHPDVRGWRPYFTGPRDRRLEGMLRWIDTLYRPGYPIDYTLPAPGKPDVNSPGPDNPDQNNGPEPEA